LAQSEQKILLVDDELIVRQSLQQWLEMEGFLVETAANGQEGLQRCKFDPIVVGVFDIRMPGMDGMTLLKEVKKVRPQISIIMMTAYASLDDAVTCIHEGAYDYLIKPFPPEKLTHLIRHLFERLELQKRNQELLEEMRAQRQFLDQFSSVFPPSLDLVAGEEWKQFREEWERRRRTLDNL
jgi:DNA-binding NtrC family response regulator